MNQISDILLVDDNPAEWELTGEAIVEFAPDMRLLAVGSRAALLDHLATRPHPHLILLDLHLGSDLGSDIARHLRDISSVPVVVLTTAENTFERARCLAVGAVDFLEKPLFFSDYPALITRIREILTAHDR